MTDVNEPQTAEEAEVLADEAAAPEELTPEADEESAPAKEEFIEYVGEPPYGAQFISRHTVTRRQIKDAWGITIPKDLEWTKTEGGPNKGRMLVPVSDMTPEAAEGFASDPAFKRVEL